jgi:hypothetical protein
MDSAQIRSLFSTRMNQNSAPRISKWPFLAGDLLLLATAGWLVWHGTPLDGWRIGALVAAVAVGAWIAVLPFVLQFRAEMKLAETTELTSVTEEIGNLESVARQIADATAQWQNINESTGRAVAAAQQIGDRMTAEAQNFGEVLTRINETEKNHLRLEIDKFRRGEGEWLQLTVRLLDHVYALHQAGVRSGQRNLIDQLSHFQSACRDTVRRVGLTPILPQPEAAFDAKQHQLFDGQVAKDGALIAEILAPGYTFQGKLVRLPLVSIRDGSSERSKEPAEETPQAQLALDETA